MYVCIGTVWGVEMLSRVLNFVAVNLESSHATCACTPAHISKSTELSAWSRRSSSSQGFLLPPRVSSCTVPSVARGQRRNVVKWISASWSSLHRDVEMRVRGASRKDENPNFPAPNHYILSNRTRSLRTREGQNPTRILIIVVTRSSNGFCYKNTVCYEETEWAATQINIPCV